MKCEKRGRALNISLLTIWLVIFLKNIKASIRISDFTYPSEKAVLNAEQIETDYISILKLKNDGKSTPNFEISDRYLISEDNTIQNCYAPNDDHGKVLIKKNDKNKFLFVQKQDEDIFIKDRNYKCSLISSLEKTDRPYQIVQENHEKITVGDIANCDSNTRKKFIDYFNLLDSFFISENEKCETVLKTPLTKNVQVIDCVGYIGHITNFPELKHSTYYICFKTNESSLLISTFSADKTIANNTFYCTFDNPVCPLTISVSLFNNVPYIMDKSLVLKPDCSVISTPIYKEDHVLSGDHYIFFFKNDNTTYYREICILKDMKYHKVGNLFSIEIYGPIICFIGSECVIKTYTAVEKMQYIMNNIESTTFSWSPSNCNNKDAKKNAITTYLKEEDGLLYIISEKILLQENILCTKNNTKLRHLLSIELVENPQYSLYYSIINSVIMNDNWQNIKYNNYLGPFVKYECSHEELVINEYDIWKSNYDNEYIHKNEELNFNIDFSALTMRLCVKQINYIDIGSVRIEQLFGFKVNNLDPLEVSAIVSLYNEDINTRLLKFAIKEDENCNSSKGFFIHSKGNYPKEIFHKDIIVDARAEYEVQEEINLDKPRYYLCMCSLAEKCNYSNGLSAYNLYTNIYINNEIIPQEKKKYVCKLFSPCNFTVKFESDNISNLWAAKVGTSCRTYAFADIKIKFKKNDKLSKADSNIIAVDFSVFYNVSQINNNILNEDLVICGNYKDQKFAFTIEADFFFTYISSPYQKFEIKNIEYENLCRDKKTLNIYSYQNGETNLYKKVAIDINSNLSEIELNIEYDHLKYYKIFFIKECHYCKGVITYTHRGNSYSLHNPVRNPEKYWEPKIGKMNRNNKDFKKSIKMHNCAYETMQNHALTSLLLFDGPHEEINFYCYRGTNCRHKAKFTLLWYHYTIYVEVTETERIIISYRENKEKKIIAEEILLGMRNSDLYLRISKHVIEKMNPGPYKIIYSRKIGESFKENYIGTFYYVGPSRQPFQIIAKDETEITLHGYFKNINDKHITVFRYITCDFYTFLRNNYRELWDLEKIYDNIKEEIFNNIQSCTVSGEDKLTCKDMEPIRKKYALCWCYGDRQNFCNRLENMQFLITEISSLDHSINPLVQINMPPNAVFMNYNTEGYFFLVEDDCHDIKHFHLKSQLNKEEHILNLYKELESPKKYNLCVCKVTQNVACDSENQFKPLELEFGYTIDDKEKLKDDLQHFNTGMRAVKDFTFSSEFMELLHKGVMQAMVFLSGFMGYKEYVCLSGVPCKTPIKMQTVYSSQVKYFLDIMQLKKMKQIVKKESTDKERENKKGQAQEIEEEEEEEEKNKENEDPLMYFSYLRPHPDDTETKEDTIYFTLSDTRECKNEYSQFYKEVKGEIVRTQEIDLTLQKILEVSFDLNIDFIPPDVRKPYEICAFLRPTDKHYYNIGNVIFYGLFNESKLVEIVSGIPFNLQLKQFNSKYNVRIRFVYEHYEDSNACKNNYGNSENFFYSESVQQLLTADEKEEIGGKVTVHKWNDLLTVLDADNYNIMVGHRNDDGSHNLHVCSCYELVEGLCNNDYYYSADSMIIKVHTAVLTEPPMNSIIHFMKPFTLKLKTSKVLNGSIRIFPIDIMKDLSKICLEINQRDYFLTFPAKVEEYEQTYDANVNFLSQAVVACWCSKEKCESADYINKVAFFKLSSPSILEVHTDMDGYFTFSFLNEWVHINDRILFVAEDLPCTDDTSASLFDDIIHINNKEYHIGWEQIIEIYGKPRKIVKEIDDNFTWISKIYKITNILEKHLKICYCFYYYSENCKDRKNYSYIGLLHNHTLGKGVADKNDQIDQTVNMYTLNGNSIKFVPMISYNDSNRDICNTRGNQSNGIIPIFKNTAFNNSANFKLRILNIFKQHYQNEINFVVCYSSYYYRYKNTYLLRKVEYNELSRAPNPIIHNYTLGQAGITSESSQNLVPRREHREKIENLLKSYSKIKQRKTFFYNYFMEEALFSNRDTLPTGFSTDTMGYKTGDENGGDDEDKENDAEINRLMDEGMRRMIEQKEKEQEEKAENGGEEKDAKERDAKEKVDEEKDAKEEDAKEEDAKESDDEENEEEEYADDENEEEEYADDEKDDESKEREDKGGKQRVFFDNDDKEDKIRGYSEGHYLSQLDNKGKNKNKNRTGVKHLLIYITRAIRKKIIIALSKFYEGVQMEPQEIMYYKRKSGATVNYILDSITLKNDLSIFVCCYEGDFLESLPIEQNSYPNINKTYKVYLLYKVLSLYFYNINENIEGNNSALEQLNNAHDVYHEYKYLRIENLKEKGFYKNQTLVQLKDTTFELKIQGKNIPPHEYTLYIVEFDNNCYRLDKNGYHVENNEYTLHSNYIIFKNVLMNKRNTYKLCILDKTQDTYNDVGILNINNYYVKLESFFDENFISSNLKKMNIMLNVCVNNNSYDAYVIKRKGSFKITLDMEKLAFSDKSQQLEEIFPEIRNHQLISCKSKKHGTIILTNTHLFFYALVTKLSFSTNHNLPFPVDVDFDKSYIYVTDLNLRKIARFQIFSEGSAINIINNAKRKRSIHDQDLRAYKRNTPMGEQGTTSKNITLFYPKEGRNFYTTDLVPSPLHGAVYPYGARNFKTALLTSKEAPKKEAIVLTKRSKQSADSYTENAHQNLLQLRMLRRDMRNEKEKTARLRRAEQSAPHNHPRGQQIKLDANPNVDASKKKPKSVANKEENALVKNVRELYNYLQKKVDNNGLINYFHGLLGPQKISKRRNSMYSFLDFFKNGKKKNLSSGNKNEVHSQIVPSSMPARAKKQARRPVPRSENAARPRITVARKKRDATENVDHSVYDEEIEKNIKNLITVVQTSNYLTNQMEYLDLKGHQSPLFISIQDNILYILDSTKNNFFSYNLYSKRIIQLEQYSAANHKFFLKNPLNFSIYRGEKTVHTPYRTNVAFVTQIRSNEIKIIDLNKNKYRIVKAIRLEKGYIHNAVNKVIAIDQNLLIITSHINAENIIYHYHFNSFDQYFSISFEYTFAKNYNSNDYLNIAPEIDIYSDSVIFFCFLNSFDLCTKVDPLTKLEISTETGVITGKLKHFGYFQLKIFAKTHFQHQVKVYTDLYSYCDVGKQYNYANQTCESCPIGTFWNSVELKCDLCKKYFKNRSTLKRGSKLITDCLCSAGYEYSEKTASCEQCKPGYYKKSTGNFICIKGCPINRKSTIYGAKSYNQMNCKCSEGYYELNGKCVLCLKNYYCPGNDQLIHCPKNKMSPEGITSADECVCKRNFIHNENNQSCTYCTSVGKVKDEVIYCSLCDPRYLDTNVFAIPNDHNYGLVDKIFNYDEDLLLQGKTLQYAYFDNNGRKNGRENGNKNNPLNDPPNDRKIDHANFGTLNINSELVLGNNPDEPNRETFAIEIDMPKPTKCVFCESGYFMDIKKERCLPCSNKYCEGFAKNPKGCPTNSVVSRTVASSIFDCKCKIGYGSINERRSALDKKLSCKLCPKNFFSHNLSEQYCLPCPQHTYTVSEGSTSIRNCLPVEGYFLLMFRSIGIEYVRYKFDINSEDRIYSYFQDSVKSFDDDVYELFLDQKFEQLFNDADNNPDKRGQQNNEAVLPAKGQQNDGAVLPPNGQQNNGAALPANGQQNNGAALPPEGQYNAQNAQNAQNEQNAPNAANAPNAQDNKYNLEHLKKMGFLKRTSLFYIYTVLMKNIEENYDWESDKMLKVTCHVNLHLKSSPNFTISYKPNLQSCVDSCKTNIYCTGVEFSRKKVEYTQIFLKNNQKIIVGYFKCKHYSFESIYDYTSPNVDEFFDENVENAVVSRTPVAYTDFILRNKNSIIFTCSIDRDRKFLLYKQYQPVGCFMGKFCPGNYTPYLISCPDNSKTVVTLAKHVDKCLCMKGYSYVGIATLRCAVCERGTYKKNVGNFKCENCPLTFSTVNIGSTSIYDCSCTPGNYLSFDTLQNFINSEKINYKNIIDQYFIVPKKKQTDVYYRTEIVKISLNNLNRIEVNEGTNQTLKREIAVCRPCSLDNHYCEGGLESDITLNNKRFQGQFHTLPKKCPNDLVIPKGIIQRSSINNCICIHGKFLRTSKDKKVECIPCPPNTFKENEYDNSCSGVCPHFSTTFIGSSYENQCFCKNSYYLVTTEDDNDGENSANRMESSKRTKSCKPCPKGAVCNRGFNINLFLHLLKNRAYNNINILDHENPYPQYGHYAVYKEKHPISDWNPLEDNDELKYSYPYYNLLLFIQKNVESGNYFFFEKNPNLYLNMEFIESIKKKKANKKATNAAEADEADEAHNPLFHQANAISILKYALKDSKSVKNQNEVIPNKHTNAIYTYLKKMVPTTLLAKPEPRPTPPLLQSNEMEYSFQEMFNKYIEEANELRKKNNKFERLPDIHVCTLPDRCLGTITNLCQEGSTGYQCNNCQKGYDMSHFKSNCNRCKNFFNEILLMVLLKMIYYIIIIVIVSLNYNSCFNKLYISGILMKIWFNGSFTLVAYGFFSPTANSFITKYWHIYKSVFLSHLKMFSYYLRVACFAHSYNTDMRYNEIWYIQKYVNIFTPLFDAISITLIMFVILHVYKLFCKKKIQNFEHILSTIPELKAKYHLDCLTKDPGGKASPKKGKKSKIYVSNKTEEGDNQDSCNHSTVTHDLEKNGVSDKENEGETNGKSALIDENAPSVPNLTNKKDAQVFCEDDVLHKVDGDDPNGECPKYELKYLNRDDKMYDIFLHETVEYIYNKKIFGPWRFMHKRNEKLGRRLLTFLHDTFPCYILLIALSSPYVLMEVIQLAFCKPIKYKSQESELYLSYLTTQKCTLSDSSFFTGIMVVILALFFYVGIFTLLITLYSKRNKYKLFNILLSNLLTGYKQGKEIFEFIFILKNIILVLLITFSIHHEFYYVILITVILTTFSILEIYSNPFDGRSFNILNISLCLGNVLNIFVALTIWGSFYWNYEQFFFVPILIILFYHLYMLHKIIREIILSRHFIRTENIISIKTAGYGESNIKHNNYKLYYKVMNKIKFFLNKNQKKNILSKQSPNNDGPNKINRMSRENIKFEPIENIIKRYNINLNDDLSKAKNLNPNEEEEKKKKEMFCIKKNHLPVNIHNVALIWYDEQNEDLLFQMPFENKFCLDLNGDKAKNKKKKFFSFFPNYARDKRRRKNIKYFVSAIIEIIDKFLCASKMGSIYENWFDFSMRFAFVYISWIKKVNKTNVVLPHNMEQLKMNIDQYVFFPLFYKCELINQERRKLSVSANTPEDQPENSAPIEALEKKQSFENTEIKISRSYGSYNQMGSLKNRKHAQEKNNHIMNDNYSDDAPSDKDAPSKGKNETRKSSEEQAQMGVLSYLKKKEKKKKKTQAKLKKKSIKMDNPEIHNHINHKDHSYKFENIFNHSMDIFSSEMFNESTFNMLISLFELYIAMKTLKSMDIQSFTKLYQLYNEKFIRFEKSLVFYINKLRDEIKLETEEIDNEIKTGDTAEKMRVKNYYFYKEELNKRKKLEQELMSKIECLKDCIDVNEKSQSLRNVLKNSRKSKPSDGILDEDIHYIFSVLQNEGTYKLDHSKTKEPNE